MVIGSHQARAAMDEVPVWARELEELPVGVAFSRDGRTVLWSNRVWRGLFGTSGVAPCAYAGAGSHVFDHEVDGELWTLRTATVGVFDGSAHGLLALVAEDVTEAIFAGEDPSAGSPPASLQVVPYLPPAAMNGAASLVEQVIEPLWAPMLLLRGEPVRVAHANGAARSQYAFHLGEIVEYATPLGVAGSLTSYFECMIRRFPDEAPLPVRLWPSQPGHNASLVMLEPSPVASELFEPVLEGFVDDRSALE